MAHKVFVITPTIGTGAFDACVDSVQKQDYSNLEHVIVCDGKEFESEVDDCIKKYSGNVPISKIVLPWNTGRNRFTGHKIYASISHLLHEPCFISFLDEDNYFESNHISSMIKTIHENNYSWAFCLRNILCKDGHFVCKDMCESLGSLNPTWVSYQNNNIDYLVDTSCYLVPVQILRKYSECWQTQARGAFEADRMFYKHLSSENKNFGCSMKYTLNYRVEGREDSVKKDFFILGNNFMKAKFNNVIPWDV